MAYVINRWNGSTLTSVEDGSVDQSFDIKFIGKNYAGYGEIQNESFLHLLENFSGPGAPPNALSGQIWYDTSSKKLKFYTGDQLSGVKIWKSTNGAEYTTTAPVNAIPGELWFDSTTSQLKVRGANGWVTIGPQTTGTGITQMVSREVKDTSGTLRSIIAATINDEVVYIISGADFELDIEDDASRITGFNSTVSRSLKKGLTLPYTNSTGVSVNGPDTYFWGTAASAKGLIDEAGNLLDISKFVTVGDPSQASKFPDAGYVLGNDDDLAVYIENDVPVIKNTTGSTIQFKVTQGGTQVSSVVMTASGIEPGSASSNLGSPAAKWSTVYANTFNGIATNANLVRLHSSTFVGTALDSSPSTIAVRDPAGDITARAFIGTATRADSLKVGTEYRLATSDSTPNTIVSRDVNRNFAAGIITADSFVGSLSPGATSFVGNATSATTATTALRAVTQLSGSSNDTIANTEFVQTAIQSMYPVGSIYINASNSSNPVLLFGFGIWVSFGAGRVPVGFNSADPSFNTAEETGGSKDAIVVAHSHTASSGNQSANHTHSGTIASAGEHSHDVYYQNIAANSGGGQATPRSTGSTHSTSSAGSHSHTVTIGNANSDHTHEVTVDSAGDSGTNANLQPYITVYMWKRIS